MIVLLAMKALSCRVLPSILKKVRSRALFIALAAITTVLASAQTIRINPSQIDVLLSAGFNPLPIAVNIITNTPTDGAPFDLNLLQVSSDSPWVTPSVDKAAGKVVLTFATSNLVSLTQTATLVARAGTETNVFFVNATLLPLNVTKLVDDPIRSRVYGIHGNGIARGNVLVIDPITGAPIGSITVGNKPTDLAVSRDGSELCAINSVDKTVTVIDLVTLRVKETIFLPVFENWGPVDTTADLEVGPGNLLYYSDGAWAPVLRVFDRVSGQVLQSLTISDTGFGDFALTKDSKTLIGWAQYGWSAGWGGSYAARFNVDANGLLTKVEQTESVWPTAMVRDPLDTPVFISSDDRKVFVKQLVFNTGTLASPLQSFPAPIYSISPGGEIVGTAGALYETETGNKIYTLPTSSSAQVITSDYARLVYFDPNNRTINTINLLKEIGPSILNRQLSPADGSIVLPPERLSWQPLPGSDLDYLYLGTSQAGVAAADTLSPLSAGSFTSPEFSTRNYPWVQGQTYYWRVDSRVGAELIKGDVYAFTVSSISASTNEINVATIQGHKNFQTTIDLESQTTPVPWKVTADVPWISFAQTNGTTPSTLTVILDASQLPAGFHTGTVQVVNDSKVVFSLPVKLRVEALKLTLLESDPASKIVYAINEDPSNPAGRAYLLEIDTATEAIERMVPVGSSVTDLAIHNGENRIYIPNWMSGSLLALSKETLALERTYAFSPFAGTGYGDGDVYRVSAGVAGRLVVEEEDQWIDVSIFDTAQGANIAKISERQGGGAFAPGERFYYHGDDNSSGAEIHKLDVTGDTFTELAHVRVESASYYGSRTVIVSEDGKRVFWNGSAFNPDLVEEWAIHDMIYATTPDGRYAFGADKIYDVSQRRAVLGMPASTVVSAFNSKTRKLVAQVDGVLRFFPLSDPITLPKPVLSAAQTNENSVVLQWIDRSLETGFSLQKRLAGDSQWVNEAAIPQNTNRWTVSGLTRESSYEFRLKAEAVDLSSEWSDVVAVSTPGTPPPATTLEVAGLSSSAVLLNWNGTAPGAQYFLERRPSPLGQWSTLAVLSLTTNFFADTTVLAGAVYEYEIRATNRWGVSLSNLRSLTVPQPSPPQAPQSLVARINAAGGVELNWSAPVDASGYRLQRRTENPTSWADLARVSKEPQAYLDTNVLAGTEYWYRVAASNAVGDSAFSPEANVLVTLVNTSCLVSDHFDAEIAPEVWAEILGGTVLNGGSGFTGGNALWFGTNTVRSAATLPLPLAFGSVIQFSLRAGNEELDGTNYWNNSEPGESILLEFSTDGFLWSTIQNIDTTYPRLSRWTDFNVPLPANASSPRTQIRWRQVKNSGAGYDAWAIDDICIRSAGPTALSAPAFILATPNSSTAVAILWFGSPGASHYVVERKTEERAWLQVGTTPAQQTYFTDTHASPATTYAYRVKAATTLAESPYSTAVFATTMSQAADWLLANVGSTNALLSAIGAGGAPNVIRYAYNLGVSDPLTVLASETADRGLPLIWFDSTERRLGADFIRRKPSTEPGITYSFELSSDLVTWTNSSTLLTVTGIDDLWERVSFADSSPAGKYRYARVAVRIQ